MKKKCRNCKTMVNEKVHYCPVCGKNLSSQIEKSDVVYFFSEFFKLFGVAGIILFSLPLYACSRIVCIDGSCVGDNLVDKILMIIPIVLLIIGVLLKKYFNRLCSKHIKK